MATFKQQIQTLKQLLYKRADSPRKPCPAGRQPLQCGIVGMGTIGRFHAEAIHQNHRLELSAVCSRRRKTSSEFGCPFVTDVSTLLTNFPLDVVIVATPHRLHPTAVHQAIKAGVHVICEKPLAVAVRECDEIIDAAAPCDVKITVMTQTRYEPSYRRVKQILKHGDLGQILRCNITESFWRTNNYYKSADWRGTWKGEGGGVLMNQAPHTLDRYIWFCGTPETISCQSRTILHDVEVEDCATIICQHSNGLQGVIHVTANEFPSFCKIEIICDRGRVISENGLTQIEPLNFSKHEAIAKNQVPESPQLSTKRFRDPFLNWSPDLLHSFYDNFADAIWNHKPPEVSVEDSRNVVELINAAHLSSYHQRHISLPVDREQYRQFQQEMCRLHENVSRN